MSSPGVPAASGQLGVAAAAHKSPRRLAVLDDRGTTWDYGTFDELVDRTIHVLRDFGVAAGGVAAILSDNRAEILVVQQAAFRGGFFFTPLNPLLRQDEVEYVLHDSGAAVLFATASHRDLAMAAVKGTDIRTIWLDGAGADDSWSVLVDRTRADAVPYTFGSVLSYTSGTAGRPKGVLRELHRPTSEQAHAQMNFGLRVGHHPVHDRHLVTAPLSHGGPMVSATHALNLGGTVVVMRRFDAEEVLRLIEAHRITSTYMVPTMYHRLLRLPADIRTRYDLSSLRSVVHTGAPCPPGLKSKMLDWLGPIVYECYAATEGLGTFTVCTPADARLHPGTVGRPADGLITIRDADGSVLPPNAQGRIYAGTLPGVAPFHYKGDPEKTARAYNDDGQFHVGDLGYLDDEGYLYLTGRSTDMVITGGVNVYPAEVESVLLRHPHVVDAAVLGLPDEEWGERVVAVIQVDGSDRAMLATQIMAFCHERLAAYKCPKVVRFVDDLGRDPSGKLRKHRLRELLT